MKQLLLRVPDDVHRRLTARAERVGRSVNAVATEILDEAADADQPDRRVRLRARAAALGILAGPIKGSLTAPAPDAAGRQRILDSTRGLGPIADALIDDERDRL